MMASQFYVTLSFIVDWSISTRDNCTYLLFIPQKVNLQVRGVNCNKNSANRSSGDTLGQSDPLPGGITKIIDKIYRGWLTQKNDKAPDGDKPTLAMEMWQINVVRGDIVNADQLFSF